ncbi:hypothetical protein VHUM_02169 [Vanrija humicola]|uniref:Asp/Glu/hydantoin racemase n=1 Tax=Vanrija humicola TaxID=5417 RepID=A0A7D8ZPJ7_VANHU|nr:hypothetical protein VHUM_02169 [Vanrija humicola]
MPITSKTGSGAVRLLVINPNSTVAFTEHIATELASDLPDSYEVTFYTAPASAPASIESMGDGIVTAAACLEELHADDLAQYHGAVVACFSNHPLVHALREEVAYPVVSILEAPLLMGAQLGAHVGILTTSPRWESLLAHDVATLGLSGKNTAGVVSSGFSVLDLERKSPAEVGDRLVQIALDEFYRKRKADVLILGCAGMVGFVEQLRDKIPADDMVVLEPVRCAFEMCVALVRSRARTSKGGIYAKPP